MDKIEPVERMLCVLDATIHVHPAIFAGVPLDGGIGIHDLELVGTLGNTELVARHNRDLREQRALGLPALGTSAYVIKAHWDVTAISTGLLAHLHASVP